MSQDGRLWALGVVGALAAAGVASRVLQRGGSAVRVGPRLRPTVVPLSKTDPLPTGLSNLDEALGMPEAPPAGPELEAKSSKLKAPAAAAGWPRARLSELYGPHLPILETLALQSIAASQKRGATVALIDASHTLDTSYAAALGVDVDTLLVAQPESFEQAFDIVLALARSGAVDFIVAVGIGLLPEQTTIEEWTAEEDGPSARAWSKNMRTLGSIASSKGAAVLFVNPTHDKLVELKSGGNALKFYSSVRVDGRKTSTDRVRFKVVKNKLAPPFRSAYAEIGYGRGYVPVDGPGSEDRTGSLVRVGPRLKMEGLPELPELRYEPKPVQQVGSIRKAEELAKAEHDLLLERILVVPAYRLIHDHKRLEGEFLIRVKVLGFWRWEWHPHPKDAPRELHVSYLAVPFPRVGGTNEPAYRDRGLNPFASRELDYELDATAYHVVRSRGHVPGPAPATVSTSKFTPPRGSLSLGHSSGTRLDGQLEARSGNRRRGSTDRAQLLPKGSPVRVGPRLRIPSTPSTPTPAPRKLTRADFRPRTRPGFYRRGRVIVRIDEVEFYSPVQDRPLLPSDWWLHGIGTLTETGKAGPSPRASMASTMWSLTNFTSSGYRKIQEADLSPAWRAFFARFPA